MKYCILLNQIDNFHEFASQLAGEIINQGDECIILSNCKIAEYSKLSLYPKELKLISKIDWLRQNKKTKMPTDQSDISWKEFFSTFDRQSWQKGLFNFTYQNSLKIITDLYSFVDSVLQKEKPDFILSSPVSNIFSHTVFNLAQKYKCHYVGFIPSRIPGRLDLYDQIHTDSRYQKTFKQLNVSDISKDEKAFALNFVQSFIEHKQLPSYVIDKVKHNLTGFFARKKAMLPFGYKYLKNRSSFKSIDYESEIFLRHTIRSLLWAINRRVIRITNRKIFDKADLTAKYFFFPLHLQPESSTSVLATYFCDQINTIANTAFALPFPYKLYVKEHPAAVKSGRSKKFYKRLKQIPNIVLVSHKENTAQLIKHSAGVITLTSTIGMEAALSGKSVYILGDVFYEYHPLCKKINGFDQLNCELINCDFKTNYSTIELNDINIRFIVSYLRNTSIDCFISQPNNRRAHKSLCQDIKQKHQYYD